MDFETFVKTFFPKRYLTSQDRNSIKGERKLQSAPAAERVKLLEKQLKDKLFSNYKSVRKAFLELDKDYDGFIMEDDLVKLLG